MCIRDRSSACGVAFEAAEDARLDGCVLAEFRIAPLLFEPFGIPGDEAVRARLSGLARSPLPSGLIVCALRHESDAQIERAAELALRWHGRGVISFDLAGPEAGWPATRHAALLARLSEAGLPLTLHAGEADEGLRVLEAARLGARRVGHGVRLADLIEGAQGAAVPPEVRERGLHPAVCPTRNVQTGPPTSITSPPLRARVRAAGARPGGAPGARRRRSPAWSSGTSTTGCAPRGACTRFTPACTAW